MFNSNFNNNTPIHKMKYRKKLFDKTKLEKRKTFKNREVIFGPSQFARGCLDLCRNGQFVISQNLAFDQRLAVFSYSWVQLYLRLLWYPVEFLTNFYLEWTLECTNYKINPHTFLEPKHEEKKIINNIVSVCWNMWA